MDAAGLALSSVHWQVHLPEEVRPSGVGVEGAKEWVDLEGTQHPDVTLTGQFQPLEGPVGLTSEGIGPSNDVTGVALGLGQ